MEMNEQELNEFVGTLTEDTHKAYLHIDGAIKFVGHPVPRGVTQLDRDSICLFRMSMAYTTFESILSRILYAIGAVSELPIPEDQVLPLATQHYEAISGPVITEEQAFHFEVLRQFRHDAWHNHRDFKFELLDEAVGDNSHFLRSCMFEQLADIIERAGWPMKPYKKKKPYWE